eukprot:TRINITY_DN30621_c1_g1_i1.p1 TRINITY_DN30621_c1_g1~~TRINITY_DN30621_c1_g1_i1.p1  ORF type:complete len:242 (+),score=67.63 TRINITY_DN30621_c1_g1_i1:63-728(+)
MDPEQMMKLMDPMSAARAREAGEGVAVSKVRIHVGPLSDFHTTETLQALFDTCGEIAFVRIMQTGKSAVIEFKTEEACSKALALKPPAVPENLKIAPSRDTPGGQRGYTQDHVNYGAQLAVTRDNYERYLEEEAERKAGRRRARQMAKRRAEIEKMQDEGMSSSFDSEFDSDLETAERRKRRRARHDARGKKKRRRKRRATESGSSSDSSLPTPPRVVYQE